MDSLKNKLSSILPNVVKPGRYWNHEIHAQHKDMENNVSIALAFPDIYEIGMSHLGLRKLYAIVNRQDELAADRVYAVWPDFEEALRKNGLPLYGIESGKPLKNFDFIGFSISF